MPTIPADRTSAYHMFHLLLPDNAARNQALADLGAASIQATFHYVPLHSSEGGRRFGDGRSECPVTDDVSGRLIRLPFHNALSDSDIERVVTALVESLGG